MRKSLLITALLIGGSALFSLNLQAQDDIDVELLWKKNCKKCHGDDGKGQTRVGAKLGLADYTDPAVQATFTDEEAFEITMNGVVDEESGKETMKPYKDKLSEAEVHALVAYVRAFAEQ